MTQQVSQLTKMLDVLLTKENIEQDVLESFFLQALYWSLGAGLLEDGRAKFNTYIRAVAAMPVNDNPTKLSGAGTVNTLNYYHNL